MGNQKEKSKENQENSGRKLKNRREASFVELPNQPRNKNQTGT
jgi:hypothetical protein